MTWTEAAAQYVIARTAHEGCQNSLQRKKPTMTLYGKMGEIQRKWDFYLNWRRAIILTQKRYVSTGQLASRYPITFTGTPASDAFSEYNLLNHLSRYLKLCTTIPLKWMEVTMCLKLDMCWNVRVHNPVTMVCSSCPWSLVSENTQSHRAIHNISAVLSVTLIPRQ